MSLSEHLEKLRHFQRLSNFRSLREGSLAMGISQAGLSKSIAALEAVLEAQLFLRSRNGLVLTKVGQEVLTTSIRILKESADLETRLRSLKASDPPAIFKIGMYDSIAVYFFTELEAYVDVLYSAVDLRMTADTSEALALQVHMGELDIAIGVNLDRNLKGSVEFFKLFDDHYSFYVSNRHDLDLTKLPFLIHARADDEEGRTVENYLKPLLKSRGAHNIYNFETLKTLTQQGVGVGVLPTQVAKPLLKRGSLIAAQIPRAKNLFGLHNIGFLATKEFLKAHRDFAEDIYRLGDRWSKS